MLKCVEWIFGRGRVGISSLGQLLEYSSLQNWNLQFIYVCNCMCDSVSHIWEGVGVDFEPLPTSATMDFSPILRRTNFFAKHTAWETSDWCDISLIKHAMFYKSPGERLILRDQTDCKLFSEEKLSSNVSWGLGCTIPPAEHESIFVILVGFLGPNTRPRKRSATRCEWIGGAFRTNFR